VIVTLGPMVLVSLDFRTSLYPLPGGSLATVHCSLVVFYSRGVVLCCVVVHVQGTPATVTHGRMLVLVLELVTVVYIYLICIPSLSYFVSVVCSVPL